MKPAAFTGLLLLLGASASAQLTLLPQIGFESAKTTLRYNDMSNLSPLGAESMLKASLRMDYRFKSGHSPFISIGTSPSVVTQNFANPATALKTYNVSTGPLQWRLEAGYQYSSKPIQLGKSKSGNEKAAAPEPQARHQCGSYSHHCCGQNKSNPSKQMQNLSMRLQPSIGFAYKPASDNVSSSAGSYSYKAGNWNTAVTSSMGVEFDRGKERLMTVSLFYTKGLGNMGTETINWEVNGKPASSSFSSKAGSWGMVIGVPFNLAKTKKPAVKKVEHKPAYRGGCGSYHHCGTRI